MQTPEQTSTIMSPVIELIRKRNGIAGQVEFVCHVRYPDEDKATVSFVGSVYGTPGPVVMIQTGGSQSFVTEPSRFGDKFSEQWVRRFFA